MSDTETKINFNMKPHVDFVSGEITIDVTQDAGRLISRQVLCTKERMVRQGLIALGWTPPPDDVQPGATEARS